MDPITHTTLGATLAYSLLGKQLGRKTLLYGAIIGNVPDLDILAYPWLGALERLEWHRGISHSLFFHTILSIPLALILKNIHHRFALSPIPVLRTILTLFLILSTHALLDACTVYGTQLLSPFSDTRYAWNIIFIIDPFFTLPLLLASIIIALPFFKLHRLSSARYAILLSTLYLLSLSLIKQHIDNRFTHARKNQGISIASPTQSAPGFPGPFLWREISRSPEGCYIAYASLFDSPDHPITHSLLSFPPALQQRWQHHPTLRRLQWFSANHGYLSEDPQGHLIYHDTRFGETRLLPRSAFLTPDNTFTLFRWKLIPNPDGSIKILRDQQTIPPLTTMLPILWQRLLGHPIL